MACYYRPTKPKTKEEVRARLRDRIEEEGLDYTLRCYTNPDSSGAIEHDPELAALWNEYIALSNRLLAALGFSPEEH